MKIVICSNGLFVSYINNGQPIIWRNVPKPEIQRRFDGSIRRGQRNETTYGIAILLKEQGYDQPTAIQQLDEWVDRNREVIKREAAAKRDARICVRKVWRRNEVFPA